MKLLGEPEWMLSPDYRSQALRVMRWVEVSKQLATETGKRSRQELFVEGQALGVPIAPVMSVAELKTEERLQQRGVFDVGDKTGASLPRWDGSVFVKGNE